MLKALIVILGLILYGITRTLIRKFKIKKRRYNAEINWYNQNKL